MPSDQVQSLSRGNKSVNAEFRTASSVNFISKDDAAASPKVLDDSLALGDSLVVKSAVNSVVSSSSFSKDSDDNGDNDNDDSPRNQMQTNGLAIISDNCSTETTEEPSFRDAFEDRSPPGDSMEDNIYLKEFQDGPMATFMDDFVKDWAPQVDGSQPWGNEGGSLGDFLSSLLDYSVNEVEQM